MKALAALAATGLVLIISYAVKFDPHVIYHSLSELGYAVGLFVAFFLAIMAFTK